MPFRAIGAGARDNFIGFYNDQGQFIGGTTTAPTAGNASGMRELLGIKSVPLGVPETDQVIIDGDDISLGEFEFDSIATRRYIVDVAIDDLQLEAYLLDTLLETIAGGTWGARDTIDAPDFNCVLLHQGRAKKYDANNRGQKAWGSILFPLCTARWLGPVALNSREARAFRLSVTPQLASHNTWGVTLSNSNAGTTGLRQRPVYSDYPYHIQAFRGNNVITAIPLDFEPFAAANTAAWSTINAGAMGVPLTVSSVSGQGVTPRTATVSAAPATDAFVTVLYNYRNK